MFRALSSSELRKPLLTLAAASMLATGLLAVRIVLTQRVSNLFLVWNLFLAWIPMLLALRLEALDENRQTPGWKFWATGLAWLLFLPNAPYIFTDLKHLKPIIQSRWWSDLILILLFAVIGMVLAFVSLQRVQAIVARRQGGVAGWLFVSVVAFLCGFGVYLGRFERWNTWDVLVNPLGLLLDSASWINRHAVKFTILFGTFILCAYSLLHSLTSLSSAPHPKK